MIWTVSSFDTAKSLEEPWGTWMKEKWYISSELQKRCGMNGHWTWKWTVSIGILKRKIYPSICYNIFLVIIKCCCGNINRKTCHSITKSAIEVIPRKRNAEIRSKPETKIWNLLCFECRICLGRIRNPQHGIQNLILSWITLNGA